jgi:hypothetical protein
MPDPSRAIVVGASAQEYSHTQPCLAGRECNDLALNDDATALSSKPLAADMFLVHACNEQETTLAFCQELRASPHGSDTPLLLAIGRYELTAKE